MSVILKALRSQQEEQRAEETTAHEGLFLGKSGFLKKNASSTKRLWLLSALLLAMAAATTTLWVWNRWQTEQVAEMSSKPKTAPPQARLPSVAVPLPTNPSVDLEQAKNLFENGQLDASLKLYQQALEQNPDSATIHNDLGLVFLRKELFSSSEKHFSRALELDGNCAECFNNLGYLKTVTGETIEAETYLKKALSLKKDYADPYFNLAVLYEKNGDLGSAVNHYQAFLKRSDNDNSQLALQIKQHLQKLR